MEQYRMGNSNEDYSNNIEKPEALVEKLQNKLRNLSKVVGFAALTLGALGAYKWNENKEKDQRMFDKLQKVEAIVNDYVSPVGQEQAMRVINLDETTRDRFVELGSLVQEIEDELPTDLKPTDAEELEEEIKN